jgi:hypothetical protein
MNEPVFARDCRTADYKCTTAFANKDCKCYVRSGTQKENYNTDQFCAFMTDEGILEGCDEGCCNNGKGCPGQCDNVPPQEPEAFDTSIPLLMTDDQDDTEPDNKSTFNRFEILLIVIILLLSLALFYYVGKADFIQNIFGKIRA